MKFKSTRVICFSEKGKDYIAHKGDIIDLSENSSHVKTYIKLGYILPVEKQVTNHKIKK